ncbi:MAG: NAD-dependent deacylase [Chloroflexi bacterium]|nr:NAD-dependent deacylase [Chloroflexota bacterium]
MLVQQADTIVALTGAGISTPSGIPDFRSPTSGVWQNVDPMEVASIHAFQQNPRPFYQWLHPLAKLMQTAQPNAAHVALAEMEQQGRLKGIITQNIDLLHQQAGSTAVYEVHGNIRESTCMACRQKTLSETYMGDYIATGNVPLCPYCAGVLKLDVILFGEMLPLATLQKAHREAERCDLMIVAGSSLEVSPVNELPWQAKQAGANLIIVNFSETHLDYLADVIINADVVEILPQLAAAVMEVHKINW